MRLVYYDHRGNGRSGRPPSETITFEQLCADADALREHLGFEEVAVLGYSFGGLSRLSTPYATPSVSATSSCSTQRPPSTTRKRSRPTLAARRSKSGWRRWRCLGGGRGRVLALVEADRALYFCTFDADLAERVMGKTVIGVEAADAGDAIIEGWDLTPRLGEISAPTLILVGRDDFVCPPSQAKIMHERHPNSQLVIFENSGHFTHVEEPEAFFDAVRGWLRRS